jgi:hypothetical protein
MHPVPGRKVGTKFGVRGKHWSCQKTSAGGIHTGLDIPAPSGTTIVAPISGTIRHRSYGPAFGKHQFAISPSAGQPFAEGEVFFAHTRTRLKDGTEVKAGQKIAEVGNEGNSTAPHVHMEFMAKTKKQWKCGIHSDPQRIIDWQPAKPPAAAPPPPPAIPVSSTARIVYQYSGKPAKSQAINDSYTKLTDGRFVCPGDGWMLTMMYSNLAYDKKKSGGIRNRLVRENPIDETCYQDHAVTPNLVAPGSFLIQPIWFGATQKGRPFHWTVRRSKSLGATTAGTRYAKWLWFSAELALPPMPGRSAAAPSKGDKTLQWFATLWILFKSLFSEKARWELQLRWNLPLVLLAKPEVREAIKAFFAKAAEDGDEPILLEIE